MREAARRALTAGEKRKMNLRTENYLSQLKRWPATGRHLLAQFDHETVVVYQAYRPAIGFFATQNQYFGGEFSFNRMSWIKPNFLWMMYRSGWGTKSGQEITLAVKLRRAGFDEILGVAVHSSFVPEIYASHDEWKTRLTNSSARLQWDPDHDPCGETQERRAIQLGLAGNVLRRYAHEWIVEIEDISRFVNEQRTQAQRNGFGNLVTPLEDVYPIQNPAIARNIGIDRN